MDVILNEVKNLMISTESTIEILRLSPQNDTTTQSLKGSEITAFLPLQGGGQEGDGLSLGVIRDGIVFMRRTTECEKGLTFEKI